MSFKDLFVSFFRTGILGYGGGPSVIPLIRYETIDKYNWMDDKEFTDVFALANALPGPIATKMATYIGYRVGGAIGAMVALLAHIMPTAFLLIFILGGLYAFNQSSIVMGMIIAVSPVIGMMLGLMAYEFLKKSWKGLGKTLSIVMILISLGLLQLLGVHPAIVITLFILSACTKIFYQNRKYRKASQHPTMNRSVGK
ncbi:chromate transporter [Ammoniphilus resinae]|uniref:Chromate transporter n=1 Tax=Ammoniphilus resinae TaxID=861532 RepID=A0ABS4GLZ5_9BACL|nr:chromate transporter [Ammoniphilus resinae]MBP1931288.1 chromate transporter [Ammoniphilus resinae]